MAMHQLPPELVVRIFESLTSVSDILSLSLACRYFNNLLTKSQKLSLFFIAMDKEIGPMEDILQLLTQNNNQVLHLHRSPPLSFTLLAQANTIARVADRFAKLYPSFRWAESKSAQRRSLDDREARRLRRAVYRFWSYTQAFYAKLAPRPIRLDMLAATERLQLLRTWCTDDLYELEDLRWTFEQLLASEICPTDGEIFSRISDDTRLSNTLFQSSSRRNLAASSMAIENIFHSSRNTQELDRNKPTIQELRFRHMQGWGSDLQNFYLVQSFLKCTPAQILWLYDNTVIKQDVEQFIELQTHDPCFFESNSMLFHDWVTVLHARGIDVQKAREAIWSGSAGITRRTGGPLCEDDS
ncbi:hypothetical protein A1O3_00001 [Capronia epimyces CBS 606.96]|uniref:F-box domain-containing protein n=1 Tax=Capronia epimyces CBS 606.96 TaxID=1182542 RepID=W9YG06_9EURO|nr:uncharacterized protein A1O3_00001 [Capronia epimyces CBS 606.96]EXJ91453.1 hypothetical protein A1O3_00001 [Capronia epimyces CBS 606.96]